MANIPALKTELLAGHPDTGAYDANDETAANEINAVNRTVNKTTMTGREVAAEVVDSAYDALTDAQKSQFLALVASDDLDPFGMGANVIKDLFSGGSATVAALAVARVDSVSRAAELGLGTVKIGHIQEARS